MFLRNKGLFFNIFTLSINRNYTFFILDLFYTKNIFFLFYFVNKINMLFLDFLPSFCVCSVKILRSNFKTFTN